MSTIPSVEGEACRMMWGVEGGIGEEGTPVLREVPSIALSIEGDVSSISKINVEGEACGMMWGVEGGIGEEGTPVLREMPRRVHHLWLVRWTK